MNPARELTLLLEKTGRTREWLVKRTGNTPVTVKQYLNGSKSSRPFFEKARKILEDELASQAPLEKPPLQWDLLFETEEEFQRADRASRIVGAESIKAFCRDAILAKADEILEKKRRAVYPKIKPMPPARVADGKDE